MCVIVVLLIFTSCTERTPNSEMTELYPGFAIDDAASLSNTLKNEYPLTALDAFFGNARMDRIGDNGSSLTITSVHDVFPVEIIRSNAYSVYKVKGGGYYYVFWALPYTDDINTDAGEPAVYSTVYYSSPIQKEVFGGLTQNSTASDVIALDPYTEISLLQSSGVYSYSLINSETVVEIEYAFNNGITNHDSLYVQNIEYIPRKNAPTVLGRILSKDFP